MKSLLLIFSILLMFPLTARGQQLRDELHSCSLVIRLDETYNRHFITEILLEKNGVNKEGEWDFRSGDRSMIYTFNHLEAGTYELCARNIFNKERSIFVRLDKDTLIECPVLFGYTPVSALRSVDLRNADTIDVVFLIDGCWGPSWEHSVWQKDRRGRISSVVLQSYYPDTLLQHNKLPLDAAESIYEMQQESLNMVNAGTGEVSTINQNLFILANNKLFQLLDYSSEEQIIYRRFMSRWFRDYYRPHPGEE